MTLMFGDPLVVGAQRERLAHDVVEIDHRAGRLAFAREGQQVADDARGPFGLGKDGVETAAHRIVERRPMRQPLGPAQDRGERVVQLVRDAGNRLAERRHLLRLEQLVIEIARLVVQLLALADVAHERFDATAPFSSAAIGARRQFDPDRGVVGATKAERDSR